MSTNQMDPYFSCDEIIPDTGETFRQFYSIYADLFPLPDEREPPEAFIELTSLNDRSEVQNLYGPWREIVSGIRLRQDGTLVGGNVFGITTSPFHRAFGCLTSIQGIYVFLKPPARGHGVMAKLIDYMKTRALAAYGFQSTEAKMSPLVFLEVNNPVRMTAAEIEEDARRSGINPYRRYMYWRRNGFAPLDFHYVQPPLRSGTSAVTCLDLFCTAGVADTIPADVIAAHLKAFISISVLKGRAATDNPEYIRMAQELHSKNKISFVSDKCSEQLIISCEALAATEAGR